MSFFYKKDIQITVFYCSKEADFEMARDSLKTTLNPKKMQLVMGDFNFEVTEKNSLTEFFHDNKLKQCKVCKKSVWPLSIASMFYL